MSGNFVSLADYAGFFGQLGDPDKNSGAFARQDVVDALNGALELRKSLSTDGSLGGDGSALIPQSLEGTLQITSYEMKELKLWNTITKKPAYAINEEFDTLESYGQDQIGFVGEGDLPPDDDSEYDRKVGKVKFLGTTRSVSLQMQLVKTISGVSSAVEQEDSNGTMQILRQLETGLLFGDDRVNPLAFKGIFQQIEEGAPDNVFDMRGKNITDKTLADMDQVAADNYGGIDQVFMSNRQKNNLTQILQENQRTLTSEMGRSVKMGLTSNGYVGNNSEFSLTSHQFIREGQQPTPDAKVRSNAPAAPASVTATPRALVGAETTKLAAATYTYEVHAFSQAGEGLGAVSTPAVVADAVSAVDVVWPQVVGAVYYKLYRKTDGGKMLKLCDVARGNGANVTYTDFGKWLEGRGMVFGLMYGPAGMAWRQLAPLLKLPLATIDARTRWSIFLFGVLQVYQPKKQIVLINVGDGSVTHDLDWERPLN